MKDISVDMFLDALSTINVKTGTIYSLQKIYDNSPALNNEYSLSSVQKAFMNLIDLNYVVGKKYQQMPDDWQFERLTAQGLEHLNDISNNN